DRSTKPGDDFFQFANGKYLARTAIPTDRPIASRRYEMTDRTDQQLKSLLEEAAANAPEQPTDLKGKVGAFYASFMDEPAIERLGATPIKPEIDAIRAAADLPALARLMGQSTVDAYPAPFGVGIDLDVKKTDAYAIYLSQSGLGLPDRDYYLKPNFAKERDAYRAYAERLLTLLNWPDPAGASQRIVALETALANASWDKVKQRDPTIQYNPVSEAQLQALAPRFPWKPFLEGAEVGDRDRFIATTNTAFPKLAEVIASTPLDTLKAWMAFRVVDSAAPDLSKPFADANFDFRDKVLQGQAEQAPRWKRAKRAVGGDDCGADPGSCFGTLSWAVGQLYAERYFPASTKVQIEALVGNIKAAFRHRLQALDWMGPATKKEALKKLDTYTIKVGYPDRWRDYSNVVIRRDDLLGNVRRAAAADWAFYVNRSKGPVDKGDWQMTPQTNDAYNGSLRDIVFPAGILQAPIFDPNADPAYTYGAVGAVIGHELTHGFDDQGRSIDASGALRDWWTAKDAAEFKRRAAILGAQYAKFEPVPGVHIKPGLTMGENIADLGGLTMALDAYHASLKGRKAPVVDGFTGDQRVFLGWAQAWAGKASPEFIRNLTTSDPHSWRKYRVNGVVRNIDAWYSAFGVKPGDAMYIPPAKRARIW
ncbi:MAG TPA: M13 family metallopeptidase, partial [Sphingomicrobium sp.]|nr:M13 family metallopeptidase [Sphingomicrobium sp.]